MNTKRLALASLVSLVIFVVLAIAISISSSLGQADYAAALWLNYLDLGDGLGTLLVYASLYGREYFWVAAVVVMVVFGDRRTKALALGLCVVFVVGIVAGEAAKAIVMRERPVTNEITSLTTSIILRVPFDSSPSFPSGHALIVSIGAFYALATFRKKWVAGLLTVEAALVCVSRVYVGAHFPLDVVAGVALGAGIAFGGLAFGRRYVKGRVKSVIGAISKAPSDAPLRL